MYWGTAILVGATAIICPDLYAYFFFNLRGHVDPANALQHTRANDSSRCKGRGVIRLSPVCRLYVFLF